jgi:hypothetical protein
LLLSVTGNTVGVISNDWWSVHQLMGTCACHHTSESNVWT